MQSEVFGAESEGMQFVCSMMTAGDQHPMFGSILEDERVGAYLAAVTPPESPRTEADGLRPDADVFISFSSPEHADGAGQSYKRRRLDEECATVRVLSPPATPPGSAEASHAPHSPPGPLPASFAPSELFVLNSINDADAVCDAVCGGSQYANAVRSLATSAGAHVCSSLDARGLGIVHFAVKDGSSETLAVLSELQPTHEWVHLRDGLGGCTPLAWAVAFRQPRLASLLLRLGASPSDDGRQEAPLRLACAAGDAAMVALLLDEAQAGSLDMNAQDENGQTVLHAACSSSRRDIVEALFAKGALASVRDARGMSPLACAVIHRSVGVLDLLVKDRALLNGADRGGRTPLHWAAACGAADIAAVLIKAGAKIESRDRRGRTPLLAAAFNGHKNVADMLLLQKADATVEDNEGRQLGGRKGDHVL